MTQITRIYVLRDPRTNEVRYVGKTVQPIEIRLQAHVRKSNERKTHRDCWIFSLKQIGMRPAIEVIEVVEGDAWAVREIFWIAHFKATGASITNQTIGGEGIDSEALSATWTEKRRKRQSEMTAARNKARAGIGWTEERRAQQCVVRKKSWENPERRARMAEKMKVVATDPAYRETMAESCRKSWTPERRLMQSQVAARVNANPERKKKQSELMRAINKSQVGQKWSPERRAAHAASLSAKRAEKDAAMKGSEP